LRKEFDLWPPITSKGFFSYSASSALSSAGLTSARKPLISKKNQKYILGVKACGELEIIIQLHTWTNKLM